MKKSYHSSEVPIRLATMTRRTDDGAGTVVVGRPMASGVVSLDDDAVAELGVAVAVERVDRCADHQPHHETDPRQTLQLSDQPDRERDAEQRGERHQGGPEGPRQVR